LIAVMVDQGLGVSLLPDWAPPVAGRAITEEAAAARPFVSPSRRPAMVQNLAAGQVDPRVSGCGAGGPRADADPQIPKRSGRPL